VKFRFLQKLIQFSFLLRPATAPFPFSLLSDVEFPHVSPYLGRLTFSFLRSRIQGAEGPFFFSFFPLKLQPFFFLSFPLSLNTPLLTTFFFFLKGAPCSGTAFFFDLLFNLERKNPFSSSSGTCGRIGLFLSFCIGSGACSPFVQLPGGFLGDRVLFFFFLLRTRESFFLCGFFSAPPMGKYVFLLFLSPLRDSDGPPPFFFFFFLTKKPPPQAYFVPPPDLL